MKLCNMLFIFSILGIIEVCNTYRILGIYALPVKSHFILMNQIFKSLLEKGHKVDIISSLSHEGTNDNYTQIIKLPHAQFVNVTIEDLINSVQKLKSITDFGYHSCKNMGSSEFLNLARNPPKDPPYDVIITQMMNYHCFTILGYLWNIPVVLISTSSFYPWMHDMIGNPENIAFSSNNIHLIEQESGFWNRFYNAYIFYLYKFSYLYYSVNQNELLKNYFGPDIPSIRELERNVSLVLVNTYFPINGPKPQATAVIEVGGIHIQNESLELSNNLKQWLDESKDGVIYFSMGSYIQLQTLPEEILSILFKTLENVAPIRVLIKVDFSKKLSIKIPNNFYISSWMPQQKILQHPNIKAFITHGGLLGTQEAIYFGVPMICIPIVFDQFTNSKNYVEKRIAIKVDFKSITQEAFDYAVNEILNNPMYRNNIQKLSKLFKDRPQSAKDTAIFWIEYVIRNGKDSLRSEAMNLTWWQLALFDVYALVFIILIITLLITGCVIKKLVCLLIYRQNNTISKKKQS